MSLKRRVLVASLVACLWSYLLLGSVRHALAAEPEDPDGDEPRLKLVTDTKLGTELEGAEDQIKEKNWRKACLTLQSILDQPRDSFVVRQRITADGKKDVLYVSAKQEANRLIAAMPEEGRAIYKKLYAAKSQELLEQAQENSDVALLAEIVRCYMNTDAGFEAMTQLATYCLDRGEITLASLYFKRLMDLRGAEKLPPLTLFKAALAFRYAGDDDKAEEVWKHLKPKTKKDGLRLGNRTVLTLEGVDKLLSKAKPNN
jgi:hypothetical protein